MARMGLRLRLVGRALGALSVSHQTPEQIVRAQRPTPHNLLLDALLGGRVRGVRWRDETVPGEAGDVPVRLYRPRVPGRLPLVLLLHGGGWAGGSLNGYDWLAGSIAQGAGAVVASVDYRLAPLHPFPAAVDDCWSALLGVVERADRLGADAERIAVVGDSAGGNLAAVVAQLARDRSGPRLAFQGLIYPATDLTLGSASLDENAHAPILTKADALAFRAHYLAGHDPADPLVSPLLAADLTGLPPALIQVAEHDPLRDDGLRYAAALERAGVPVRSTVYPGMPHGFLAFPRLSRSAPQALDELTAELRTAFAPPR